MTSKKNANSIEMAKYLEEKFRALSDDINEIKTSVASNSARAEDMAKSLSEINVTLARQEEQLTYHIKRTDMLEEDLRPVKANVDTALKVGGIIMFVISLAAGLGQILQWSSGN
jgi:SMC interacting uncharacterized protein involved in chromosome segregation